MDGALVHVREYFFPTSGEDFEPLAGSEETQLDEAFGLFIKDEDSTGGTVIAKNKVKTQILRGNAVDSLLELSGQEDTDLIVIGTTGLQGFLSRISGSTSLKVATRAHCPVVLVPREAFRICNFYFGSVSLLSSFFTRCCLSPTHPCVRKCKK